MKTSLKAKIKDEILANLLTHKAGSAISWEVAKAINRDFNDVYALGVELGVAEHTQNHNVSTIGSAYEINMQITPVGRSFLQNGGYKKQYNRDAIKNFPANYWWIISLFTFSLGLFSDILKDVAKEAFLRKQGQLPPNHNQPFQE